MIQKTTDKTKTKRYIPKLIKTYYRIYGEEMVYWCNQHPSLPPFNERGNKKAIRRLMANDKDYARQQGFNLVFLCANKPKDLLSVKINSLSIIEQLKLKREKMEINHKQKSTLCL